MRDFKLKSQEVRFYLLIKLRLRMLAWKDVIGPLKNTDEFKHALKVANSDRASGITVYPPQNQVFNAFAFTPLSKLKVVIIGQDPYHEPNQAMGLSFSVPVGTSIPPSLVNIYKELADDIKGFIIPDHGNLIPWARQGVLLLNAVLTVRAGQAGSHAGIGWEVFTDKVIEAVNKNCEHVVFILWGAYAQRKGAKIDASRHLIISSPHPSPLSAYRGFFGSKPFSRTNQYLIMHGLRPINWQLPPHLEGNEEL